MYYDVKEVEKDDAYAGDIWIEIACLLFNGNVWMFVLIENEC